MKKTQLIIDLNKIRNNFLIYQHLYKQTEIAPVVKADAYGLGIRKIASFLSKLGAKTFFIATLQEGIFLRKILGEIPQIYVLNGFFSEKTKSYQKYSLSPILNSWSQVQNWYSQKERNLLPKTQTAALHFDTGLNRLGIGLNQVKNFDALSYKQLESIDLIISHLACADTPHNPMNAQQLFKFNKIIKKDIFKDKKKSLANSAGAFIHPDYSFDLIRVGIGLYGGKSAEKTHLNIRPCLTIKAPVLQTKFIKKGESIGYGAEEKALSDIQIAILGLGYADGILRSGSQKGTVRINNREAPIIGPVSMDMTTINITEIPEKVQSGDYAFLLGDDLNAFAESCQTISYEILTRLGNRLKKVYKNELLI